MARPQNKHFVKNIPTGGKQRVAFYTKFNGWKNTMKKFWQNMYDEVYFLCCCLNVMLSHFFREVKMTWGPRDLGTWGPGDLVTPKNPSTLKYIFYLKEIHENSRGEKRGEMKSWQNIYEEVYFLCCCQNVMLSHFFREVKMTEGPRDLVT